MAIDLDSPPFVLLNIILPYRLAFVKLLYNYIRWLRIPANLAAAPPCEIKGLEGIGALMAH
jgi:hypothetical protein